MRVLGLFLAIVLAALPALGAKQNVTGKWEFTSTSPLGERTQTVEMTQEGTSLRVSMTNRDGQSLMGTGTVQDGQISWAVNLEGEGGELRVTYSGRIQENGMKGKVTYGALGRGKWSATAQ